MPQNNGEVRKAQRKAGADARAERWRIHREHCTAAGHVAIREKSYRAAQERQRLAQARADWELDRREGAEKWARDCCDEERRIRERLTFVYGVARAHGATVEALRGDSA